MTRTGQPAVDYGHGRVGNGPPPPAGMQDDGLCLMFVREVFDVPAYYGSAIDAWNGAQGRVPGDRFPPAAVPIWFATPSKFDHIAFHCGSGEVVTTFNDDVHHYAGPDGIAALERDFDGVYLGWAPEVNEITVYVPNGGGADDGGDWLSYLNYDEQRRVLAWADQGQVKVDQLRSVVDAIRPQTDRLPAIHSQVDLTAAGVQNNNNGITQIIDMLSAGISANNRWIGVLIVLILLSAAVGIIVAILVNLEFGAISGAGLLVGGLIGSVIARLAVRP